MKLKDCMQRINDLRIAKHLYTDFLYDEFSIFYKDLSIKELLKRTDEELYRLEELVVNEELNNE